MFKCGPFDARQSATRCYATRVQCEWGFSQYHPLSALSRQYSETTNAVIIINRSNCSHCTVNCQSVMADCVTFGRPTVSTYSLLAQLYKVMFQFLL